MFYKIILAVKGPFRSRGNRKLCAGVHDPIPIMHFIGFLRDVTLITKNIQ